MLLGADYYDMSKRNIFLRKIKAYLKLGVVNKINITARIVLYYVPDSNYCLYMIDDKVFCGSNEKKINLNSVKFKENYLLQCGEWVVTDRLIYLNGVSFVQ